MSDPNTEKPKTEDESTVILPKKKPGAPEPTDPAAPKPAYEPASLDNFEDTMIVPKPSFRERLDAAQRARKRDTDTHPGVEAPKKEGGENH